MSPSSAGANLTCINGSTSPQAAYFRDDWEWLLNRTVAPLDVGSWSAGRPTRKCEQNIFQLEELGKATPAFSHVYIRG